MATEKVKEVVVAVKLRDGLTAGMAKINGVMGETRGAATQIGGAFSSLRGIALSLGASFVGVAAVGAVLRRSTQEAREAIEARQQLTAALGDNVDELGRVQRLAAEIQQNSTFGDDQVVKLAAGLLDRGVAVGDLEKAIRATVEVSAALGKGLDETGAQIAQTFGGTLPRELARAVPALKDLTEAELRAGGAAELLFKRYEGRALNLTDSPLGKIEQANNRIGDSLEGIGETLTIMGSEVLPVIADYAEKIAGFVGKINPRYLLDAFGSGLLTTLGIGNLDGNGDAGVLGAANKELNAKADAETRATIARRAEQYKANGERLKALQDELNAIVEQKDAASGDRRVEVERERIEILYQLRRVSAVEYFATVERLEREALDRSLGDAQGRLDAAQKRLADETSKPDKNEVITPEALKAQEEINRLTAVLLDYEQKRELLALNQQARRASAGEAAALQVLEDVIAAQQRYNESLERTANLEQIGATTSADAKRRALAAQLELERTVNDSNARLRSLNESGLITDGQHEDFKKKVEDATQGSQKISAEAKLILELAQRLQAPFESFFNSIIDGTKKAKDAFRDLGVGILKTIQNMLVSKLVEQFLGLLLGATATTPGGDTVFKPGLFAGLVGVQKNAGGFIPGGGPDVDSVPAVLTPGEFVVRRSVAQRYASFLTALNAGQVSAPATADLGAMLGVRSVRPQLTVRPRANYNTGGEVGPSGAIAGGASSARPQPVVAQVLFGDQEYERFYAHSDRYFAQALQRHANTIQQMSGPR